MVLKKRLDYGFNGYQIPVIPRAPRSVRRRGPQKKSTEDSHICAFDLLAAVAGKLLQEGESSASSNASEAKDLIGIHSDGIKQERIEDNNKAFRSECLDQGSCVESTFVLEPAAKEQNLKSGLPDFPNVENDSVLAHTSIVTSSDSSKKVDCELKLGICSNKNAEGGLLSKEEGSSYHVGDVCNGKIENGIVGQLEDEVKQSEDLTGANTSSVKNRVEKCMNIKPLINSDSSVQLSLYRDPAPIASFPKHRNDVNLGIRDDDDNSFGCNKFSTKIRTFRPQRNGYRRLRKMLTAKYWKMAPKLKDYELLNTNKGMRPFYRSRKRNRMREMHHHQAPLKRRKLCERSFVVAYDQEASSESISNSPEKGVKGGNYSSNATLHRGNGGSTSVKVHKKPKDSNGRVVTSHLSSFAPLTVKFSIKSFKVPEFYIEVPETATIGSLKRTVMETVTAILGGGLRVGVILEGKKVRDDNRTLQQAGISRKGNLESLGFVLEPNFAPVPESPKDSPLLLQCDAEQKLFRSSVSPVLDSGLSNDAIDPPTVTRMDKQHEVNNEIEPSPKTLAYALTDGAAPDTKALVPIQAVSPEALAVVPLNPKTRRSEASQRRTRRPFSVTEVEALVEAVEMLGTGRWRDVKMRAFDNADHRTYVDLKDKWKTLVHTAGISPQQRRGEPVPQELLDRVLSAHAYWSQHQSKQHGKHHHIEPLKIVDAMGSRSIV